MKRSTTRWSTAVATAALCVLPVTGWAQSSPTNAPQTPAPATQQPSTQQPSTQPPSTSTQAGGAQEHLQQAKQALNDIQASSITGQARSRIMELRRHMTALERSVAANDSASATAESKRSPRATSMPRGAASADWQTEVAAVDRILTNLLGSGTTAATGAGETPATTGTSGASGKGHAGTKSSTVTLDETTRTKLQEVRTHITAFAAAMAGTSAPTPSAQAEASEASTTAPSSSSSAAATTGTTGTMTSSSTTQSTTATPTGTPTATPQEPSSTTTTQSTTMSSTTAPQAAAAAPAAGGQVDETAAKRHLTEARNTLSEVTQLPAAAQLSGEARTHVSQLITNFNELITTNANWREPYAKVSANLAMLLGPEEGSATATPAPTGTTGAVGTSGTASATLDPALRQKLVQFRAQLKEFERAAGGAGPSPSPSEASATMKPMSSATTSSITETTTGTTGTTEATATGTTGSTSPSATPATSPAQPSSTEPSPSASQSQYPTGTSGTASGQSATAQGHKSEAAGHSEALQHIDAIEAILGGRGSSSATTGTAGTTASSSASANVTLDRAQIEQVKMHLSELRRLLNQAESKK